MSLEKIIEMMTRLSEIGGSAEIEAVELLLDERIRQVEVEGWTPAHDDAERRAGQLAAASACYLLEVKNQNVNLVKTGQLLVKPSRVDHSWPFHQVTWKPSSPRRMAVKGNALALAELARLIRCGIP